MKLILRKVTSPKTHFAHPVHKRYHVSKYHKNLTQRKTSFTAWYLELDSKRERRIRRTVLQFEYIIKRPN